HESADALVRYQQVRPRADDPYLVAVVACACQQRRQLLRGGRAGEELAVPARADGREPRERVVRLDARRQRAHHATSLRPRSSTSPAPIARQTSPAFSWARRKRSASSKRGNQATVRPCAASAAASAISLPSMPGKSSGRSRAW